MMLNRDAQSETCPIELPGTMLQSEEDMHAALATWNAIAIRA